MSKQYQIVTDRIVAMLEAGTRPWSQPWAATGTQTHLRETGSRIVNEDLHQEIMQNAARIDDLMVTMCTEMRRLCAEPYGDAA